MRKNIPVLVDGAQAVPHIAVDVQALDCDFYTFSGQRFTGRRESACFTARPRCWKQCLLIRAAAT